MKPTLKKLKNGTSVVLVPQKGATSMTLMVFVRVGSRYETAPINGASHFIEHLMFKGTKRRPDTLSISKELDRYGAEYNAYTSKDHTAYYIKIDAKQTPLAVDMLSDMIFHSTYDPKEIQRERGVIVEEINMYEDNPRMHIEDLLEKALFPDHPLGWEIIGPRKVIQTVPREELIAYRDRYYIPSRVTIAVAGKLMPGLWKKLETSFGKIPVPKKSEDKPAITFSAPKKLQKPIELQTKKTEQVQLGMAFYGFPYGDKRLPAAQLLATILGGTMSSRLFIQVRERRGLCYSIHASHQCLEDAGIFNIMAGLEKNRIKEAVRVIKNELARATRERIKPEELARAKDHLRGKLMLAFEDSSAQADWYGKQWMFQKKTLTPEERLRQIDRVGAAEIQRVARIIFRQEKMAASIIGPFEKKSLVKKFFV